ncbi:MAG: hypothetical protein ACYYK0_03655 [Candidatus Eutrophobiaceae bacterium]
MPEWCRHMGYPSLIAALGGAGCAVPDSMFGHGLRARKKRMPAPARCGSPQRHTDATLPLPSFDEGKGAVAFALFLALVCFPSAGMGEEAPLESYSVEVESRDPHVLGQKLLYEYAKIPVKDESGKVIGHNGRIRITCEAPSPGKSWLEKYRKGDPDEYLDECHVFLHESVHPDYPYHGGGTPVEFIYNKKKHIRYVVFRGITDDGLHRLRLSYMSRSKIWGLNHDRIGMSRVFDSRLPTELVYNEENGHHAVILHHLFSWGEGMEAHYPIYYHLDGMYEIGGDGVALPHALRYYRAVAERSRERFGAGGEMRYGAKVLLAAVVMRDAELYCSTLDAARKIDLGQAMAMQEALGRELLPQYRLACGGRER